MNTSTSTIRRAPIILTFLLPIVMLATPTIPAWAADADPAPIHSRAISWQTRDMRAFTSATG